MTRSAQTTSLSPFLLALGQGVFSEHSARVARMLAFAGARLPEHIAGMASGVQGWSGGTDVATHEVTSASPTATRVYEFRAYIDPDLQKLRISASCDVPAGDSAQVVFTVGGYAHTMTFPSSAVSRTTILTSKTGTGLVDVTVDFSRPSGTGTVELESWQIRGEPIPDADLPGPPDE